MPDTQTEHKPLVRCTVTLIFPNLGPAAINEQVTNLVSQAVTLEAKETYVTICPEDEADDD